MHPPIAAIANRLSVPGSGTRSDASAAGGIDAFQLPRTVLRSGMGSAINYALNNWDALVRYATDPSGGDLATDNNAAERAIRPLVIGRKNYHFIGSDTGGRTAAILYSLTATAKRHGLAPHRTLRSSTSAMSWPPSP